MPKQRHKPYYKRGVFKLKKGGPKFRPRGFHREKYLFLSSELLFGKKEHNAEEPASQIAPFITPERLHQGRR